MVSSKKTCEQALTEKIKRLESTLKEKDILIEQLQASEKAFKQVTNSIDEVFWMADIEKNKALFINKAYEYIWGRSIKEHLADPVSFLKTIHPDDREKVVAEFPKQQLGTYNVEYRIINKKGDVRWINDKAFPIKNKKGEVYRIVGVARDVTERKHLLDDLRKEKERTSYLLENVLPKAIIDKLKASKIISLNKSPAIAQNIDHATVLFSDVVGFTEISKQLPAKEVVNKLNKIFRLFDELIVSHKVEKIKTIGDNYMLAGGVPDYQEDHAQRVANTALDMLKKLKEFNKQENESFQIRIGIHSGPLVAGIIGFKKYLYDIWGDTVNLASRMESQGSPGEIQVSEETYQLLKDDFELEEQGIIDIKGCGNMQTYILKQTK